jgi:hypothetical protein
LKKLRKGKIMKKLLLLLCASAGLLEASAGSTRPKAKAQRKKAAKGGGVHRLETLSEKYAREQEEKNRIGLVDFVQAVRAGQDDLEVDNLEELVDRFDRLKDADGKLTLFTPQQLKERRKQKTKSFAREIVSSYKIYLEAYVNYYLITASPKEFIIKPKKKGKKPTIKKKAGSTMAFSCLDVRSPDAGREIVRAVVELHDVAKAQKAADIIACEIASDPAILALLAQAKRSNSSLPVRKDFKKKRDWEKADFTAKYAEEGAHNDLLTLMTGLITTELSIEK